MRGDLNDQPRGPSSSLKKLSFSNQARRPYINATSNMRWNSMAGNLWLSMSIHLEAPFVQETTYQWIKDDVSTYQPWFMSPTLTLLIFGWKIQAIFLFKVSSAKVYLALHEHASRKFLPERKMIEKRIYCVDSMRKPSLFFHLQIAFTTWITFFVRTLRIVKLCIFFKRYFSWGLSLGITDIEHSHIHSLCFYGNWWVFEPKGLKMV